MFELWLKSSCKIVMMSNVLHKNVLACFFAFFFTFHPVSAFCSSYLARNITVSCDRWPNTSSLKRFGEDSARIAGAKTNEEKAVAVWRFIQQTTEVGSPPREPAHGIFYIFSPLKLLNVYGVHWCDGLSRIMNMTWRSLGYRAQKLYEFGHTLADCWWKDQDGVERWHVFDLSQHWYVHDRTGGHISTAEELSLDHSLIYIPSKTPIPSKPFLMQPSYVHAGHRKIEPHKTGIDLRPGESIKFLWGNEGKPYYNLFGKRVRKDFEHGPYPITYGNGRLVYSPDLSKNSFLERLYVKPLRLACTEQDGLKPALHPKEVNNKTVAIFRISLPYVISDAWLEAKVKRKNLSDMIRFLISVDGGRNWRSIWEADKKVGIIDLHKVNFCDPFDISKKEKPTKITPFGRYDFLMKIEMKSSRHVSDCGLEELSVVTVFQHNMFSLPMLWPGTNQITVSGELEPQSRLQITYVWDDAKGKARKHTVETGSTPFHYEILAKGRKWGDVACRSMEISLLPKSQGTKPFAVSKPDRIRSLYPSIRVYPTKKSIGRYYPKPLNSPHHYIRHLHILLEAQKNPEGQKISLKKLSNRIRKNVLALGALQDPSAKEILEEVIKQDTTHPFQNKVWACQSLFQSIGHLSAPIMIMILERDANIDWKKPTKWSQDAMWLHTTSIAAAILAKIKDFDGKERAADLIADILEGKRTSTDPQKIWRGKEICWGLIKALGKLGSQKHIYLLKKFLKEESDATAVAIRALEDIGDTSVIPDLVHLLNNFEYSPIGLYAIEALGELGDNSLSDLFIPFLEHWDEDFRGAAATALGKIGDRKAISRLKEMLKNERFPWVISAIKESIRILEKYSSI